MQMNYQLRLPQAVYSGINALNQLENAIGAGKTKAAIFTDRGIMEAGLLEKIHTAIRSMGLEAVILSDLPAEPTCDQAQETVELFKKSKADVIVAVGGGSVMDIAKLASILTSEEYTVRDLLDQPLLGQKQIRSVMIPTTAGTGAEATPNSIVAVPEKELKVGIVNPAMIPDAVILDAEMIRNLPRKIAASTGVDALSHAIECFTSKKANPFSDLFALEALDLIMNHIEKACDDPEALEDKNAMQTAAFYAGIAITASGTTAVHALSYPLGGKYHIPHGVSNAMMLLPVMRFNEPMCRERLARAYDRVVHEGDGSLSTEQKSAWIINRLGELVTHLDIPVSLREYGVPEEDLELLAGAGIEVRRLLDNNMREVTLEDARALYREII